MKVLLNSEIKLYRNISGYNFPSKLNYEEAQEIVDEVSVPLLEEGYEKFTIEGLNSFEKLDLFEEGKITAGVLENEKLSAVFLQEGSPAVLLNGEDHIMITKSSDELNFEEIYEEVSKVDDLLDSKLIYAYREDFGYLTSNPQRCGTGMVLESIVHLPATDYLGANSILSSLKRLGYSATPFTNGSSKFVGSIFRISPDRTIGQREEEYIDKFTNILKEVVDMEEQNRKKLYLERIIDLEDLVNRAYATLKYCRIIDEEEMISKMSDLFLGIELSILKPKKDIELMETINKFKNGHLQIERGSLLDVKSRNILRANNIRKMMKEVF
ncbi:ATP--guanido phosphotransferase [Anaerosphaera multitolerans]|uniref:ATP--guanido phosphotransferase n=1 Tax=Anaerosphaera multitolerans TaxID=2487351 RepID=A0A437S5H6_9FIRM|nr:ATP--guanido phosphotransferase [Anaerosphaera multitolerans]RVU54285.1 ATP--guanido phosphotransferase [Anaerosphaera multitolerans]